MDTIRSHQKVFYSWQSDLANRTNRTFIQEALQKAIDAVLESDLELDLILDRDTQDTPGAPDIAQTILSKIDQAAIVVADVSIINPGISGRLTPNPNVLFELGYAVHALSWDNVLLVFNQATGRIEDLPFDLRPRRPVTYKLSEQDEKAAELRDFARKLQAALGLILERSKRKISAQPQMSLVVTGKGRNRIILGIKNDSTVAAKAPYLSFTLPQHYTLARFGIDGNGTPGFLGTPHSGSDQRKPRFGGMSGVVIPPDITVEVVAIDYNGPEEERSKDDLLVEFELAAENIHPIRSSITVSPEGTVK